MDNLIIPKDAFSHGQIRSKLWLSENFARWSQKHLDFSESFELNWYGSWVGIGPFLMLENCKLDIKKLTLFDLTPSHLEISKFVLDFWRCESLEIVTKQIDVNEHEPDSKPNQIFVNSSCEHMSDLWIKKLPQNSYVLAQSTNMEHSEHINRSLDLKDFASKYADSLQILETNQIDFNYPDKSFSRFMLFGIRK